MSVQQIKLNKLAKLIEKHTLSNGLHDTQNKSLSLFKATKPEARNPFFYEPSLLIVAQGKKCCYIGDKRIEYDTGNFLTVFLPMPVKTDIVEASEERPFLVAGIGIDLGRLADILLRIERVDESPVPLIPADSSGIFSTPINDNLLDPTIRLLESLANPRDTAIVGDLILDELHYRVLCDERGGDLRTLLQQRGQIRRMSKAVSYIHQHLDEMVSVDDLADMVHMSRTTFFENFKTVMHVTPLQYAKSLKLFKARTLIQEGKNASEAGYLVGYNSPAQFSREYKRHFGYAPSGTVRTA